MSSGQFNHLHRGATHLVSRKAGFELRALDSD